MKPRQLLLLFSSDPGASGRVAEGVRVAAGLNANQQVQVTLYLHGEAIKALAPDAFSVKDAEVLLQNWVLAAPANHPVLIQHGGLRQLQIEEAAAACHEINLEEILRVAAAHDWVVHWDSGLGPAIFTPETLAKSNHPMNRLPWILNDSKPPDDLPARHDLSESSLDYPRLLAELFRPDR